MFLSLETLTSIIRTGLPILGELTYLVNSVIIFLSQMTSPRLLTCLLTRIPDYDYHSDSHPALLDLFISPDTSICSTMAFPYLEILIMLVSQFPLTFHQINNMMPGFIA